MQRAGEYHWYALKRLLRYLHGTMRYGMLLHHSTSVHLHAFTDADWVGDKDNFLSTTGYIVFLGPNPIAWNSK